MATVAIILKTKKKLINDEYAVALRVTLNKIRKYYSLNSLSVDQTLPFKCKIEEWLPAEDNNIGQFIKSVKGYKAMNQVIVDKLALAQKILSDYDRGNIAFDFDQFEEDLRGNRNKSSKTNKLPLLDYYDTIIAELEQQQKVGLAAVFTFTKSTLNDYKPDLSLKDINVRFLEAFEAWLRNVKKLKDTSISVKIRNIQRVINLAIADKLFKQEDYPFGEKKYSVNKRLNHTTRKRSVSSNIISKVKHLKTEPGTSTHLAQSIFLFSYYTRGMNFIDIAGLKWTDIHNNEINYVRKKTGQQFNITINEHSQAIMNYFKHHNSNKGNYIFPIYNDAIHITAKQKYERKKSALKLVNLRLRDIAISIDEPKLNLTTYVSRHSYATNLKRSGVATAIISEALGHATENQTQTYLDEFESGVIESWENKLFDL
ncbi:site-specific integrase [Mucilaginibacter terrae]|uniref:site-specific integrase n=1 Tax=Mucilaginibacter terrae TaxID=1955052 RepID=UPI003631EA87